MNANIPWRPSYDALVRFASAQTARLEALAPKMVSESAEDESLRMEVNRLGDELDAAQHTVDDLRRQLEEARETLAKYSAQWGAMYARQHS